MIELKTYKMVDEKYCTDCICVIPSEVYLKSDADKVIARHKYKRCLAMARWCERKRIDAANYRIPRIKWEFYDKWHNRWLKIAEQFKEAK